MVKADRATRARAPGGSFIWPNTSAAFDNTELPSEVLASAMLVEQVVAFAGTFANACKHRGRTRFFSNVVDEFLDEHGFTDARTN